MKKILILLILVAALAAAGCADKSNASDGDISTDVQQVQVVTPVNVHDDHNLYWAWHNETKSILEDKIGEDVKLYAFSIQYKGKLVKVTEFYAVVEDNVAGEIYIDIGSINAIGGEVGNQVA